MYAQWVHTCTTPTLTARVVGYLMGGDRAREDENTDQIMYKQGHTRVNSHERRPKIEKAHKSARSADIFLASASTDTP